MLYALVAVFAACAGYAAGRLHQWNRMDADREDAYQAGYDAAARSTFTMAARMAGRENPAARASAAVQPGPPPGEGAPPPGLGTPFPVPEPPVLRTVAGPAGRTRGPGAAGVPVVGLPGGDGLPGGSDVEADRDGAGAAGSGAGATGFGAGSAGFGPSGSGAGRAAADAGVPAAGSAAGPVAKRSKVGRITGRLPRRGRHLVPQELVEAATYRLNPDRVARAKVPGALPTPDAPGVETPGAEGSGGSDPQPGGRPSVPKPRGS